MLWFGVIRLLTSTARWILHVSINVPRSRWILLSPPFCRLQFVYSKDRKRLIKLRISTYFDWATLHEVFVREEYDLRVFKQDAPATEYYEDLLSSGRTPLIVDLGMNVGISATFFKWKYPGAHLVGLEPDPRNFESAEKNLATMTKIDLYRAAIGISDGHALLFDPRSGNNAYRTFGSPNEISIEVPMMSMATILERHSECVPFLIKIDIEGHEKELFSARPSWISQFKVLMIETHDWMLPGEACSSSLLEQLSGLDRDLLFRGENLFSVRNDPPARARR